MHVHSCFLLFPYLLRPANLLSLPFPFELTFPFSCQIKSGYKQSSSRYKEKLTWVRINMESNQTNPGTNIMEYFMRLINNWIIRPLQAVFDPTRILDNLEEIKSKIQEVQTAITELEEKLEEMPRKIQEAETAITEFLATKYNTFIIIFKMSSRNKYVRTYISTYFV